MRYDRDDQIDVTFEPDSRFIEGNYADIVFGLRSNPVENVYGHGSQILDDDDVLHHLNTGLFSVCADRDTIHVSDDCNRCLSITPDNFRELTKDLFRQFKVTEWEPDLRF